MDKISINIGKNDQYYIIPLYKSLEMVQKKCGFELELTEELPDRGIFLDGKLTAMVDFSDFAAVWTYMRLHHKDVPILKWQVDTEREFLVNKTVISAGYFTPLMFKKSNIQENKTIDFTAQMRFKYKHQFNQERYNITEIAKKLEKEGYSSSYIKTSANEYFEKLGRSNIGFNWRGKGHLNFRVIEYIQNEIVMITDPLGKRFPIRDDVIIEDDIHAVFCDKPEKFYETAKSLLKDKVKLNRIRKNVKELWEEKLCPVKTGEWYYRTLKKL